MRGINSSSFSGCATNLWHINSSLLNYSFGCCRSRSFMKSDRIVWTNMPSIVLFAWYLSSIYMCYKFRIFLKEINLIIWILFTLNDWRIEFFIIFFIFDVYFIFSLRILPIWVLSNSFLNHLWLFGSFWHGRKLEVGLIIKRYLILWLWIIYSWWNMAISVSNRLQNLLIELLLGSITYRGVLLSLLYIFRIKIN